MSDTLDVHNYPHPETDEVEARAKRNRGEASNTRVFNLDEEFARTDDFKRVAIRGGKKPPVATRTPGQGQIFGITLVDRTKHETAHLIQVAYIEPGDRKYLHHHTKAETIWVILEGEGEFYGGPSMDDVYPVKAGDVCHSLPGQWHGMGNTGTTRLRYFTSRSSALRWGNVRPHLRRRA